MTDRGLTWSDLKLLEKIYGQDILINIRTDGSVTMRQIIPGQARYPVVYDADTWAEFLAMLEDLSSKEESQ